ncbi:hypothetical protein B0T26DRAFT_144753 [Lasiosphaeria miniovina]|uniref:Uncharacterized protein n=1 Tax=Lasiosphaeria miniovina TaxID=1954250 RepID=A0AA40B5K8_9PEZI|nr:uncharacterized protein B0T26DRAFT_144753 [Lasiosphaeria miniovina]KAK0727778.1 hypothetical protein B0T26DRAFT_144753 [Lasiosphaeria miniovina]
MPRAPTFKWLPKQNPAHTLTTGYLKDMNAIWTCSSEPRATRRARRRSYVAAAGRLLGDPSVPHLATVGAMLGFVFVLFSLLSLFCFATSLYTLIRAGIIPIPSWFRENIFGQISNRSTGTVFTAPFFIFIWLSILVPVFALTGASEHRPGMNRESAIAYDWDCRVVHVAISPWRQYRDVSFAQGARIAKAWFNA